MSDIAGVINSTLNGQGTSALGKQGTTITTFIISLGSGFVLFAVQFVAFLIVRNYLWAKRIYQPRSFLVPVSQRIKPPHNNPFKWLSAVFKIQADPTVLGKAGMDAYFFLRFLSMCLKIFTPMAAVIMPILIPLNSKGGRGDKVPGAASNITGLDTLGWSNISQANTSRYWAHLFAAIGVVFWVCFIFYVELLHYISKRQHFLSSPAHRLKASSTTVLIQDIPDNLCNEDMLQELYGDFPGSIRRVWINRDFTTLVEKDKLRKSFESLLENAETNLLRDVAKKSRKATPNGGQGPMQESPQPEQSACTLREGGPLTPPACPNMGPPTPAALRQDLEYDLETKAAWTRFLTPKQRPTMRITEHGGCSAARLPLIGPLFATKVDSIYYCRRELARLNKEIELEVAKPEMFPENRSAFVQFNSQKAAQLACQSVASLSPSHMRKRLVEISPGDINWPSLNLSWRARYWRLVRFLIAYVLLLVAFGIISVFTGILSRVSTVGTTTPWLRWVNELPPWLISFIQGTLPPLIQVVILSGPLPIVLRHLTNKTRGATTGQEGERSLQSWYFFFLLMEVFIIPTISTGLLTVLRKLIEKPTSVSDLLVENLPTAANYYFSFLIVQALSLSATSILQTIRLFKFYVFGRVNTPDAVFEKLSWTNLTRIGSNIPWYTTFAVIGLVYSTIAPLILLFMLITFSLFWVVIKNNLLYCVRTGEVDGGGLFFPNAINQLFTGLYFLEFFMVGLFFLVRNTEGDLACGIQGLIMAIFLVLTILYHIWLMNHLESWFKYAPLQLDVESKALLADHQEKREKQSIEAQETSGKAVDLGYGEKASSDLSEHTSQTQDIDKEAELSSQTRPAMRQRHLTNRTKSLQAQQLEDGKAADRILTRLNQPIDEGRLANLERDLEDRAAKATGISKALLPRREDVEAQMLNDPISKIIMLLHDELEHLNPEERDMLVAVAFLHPVLRDTRPTVWIPRDEEGVSDDEVKRTRALSGDIVIDNRGAYFDRSLKVEIDRPPPDMSEFAHIIAEL